VKTTYDHSIKQYLDPRYKIKEAAKIPENFELALTEFAKIWHTTLCYSKLT
jgi:hypothetical protein